MYLFFLLFFIGVFFLYYPMAKNYYYKKCIIKKYGIDFNENRKTLGLYSIPMHWSIEQLDSSIIWKNPQGKLGHRWKNISFKECNILNELDLFSLEYDTVGERYSKTIVVEALFDKNSKVSTVIYNLQIGDKNGIISKNEADSILALLK